MRTSTGQTCGAVMGVVLMCCVMALAVTVTVVAVVAMVRAIL